MLCKNFTCANRVRLLFLSAEHPGFETKTLLLKGVNASESDYKNAVQARNCGRRMDNLTRSPRAFCT